MGQWKDVIDYKHVHACTRAHVYLYACLYIPPSICLSVFTELVCKVIIRLHTFCSENE